MAVTRAELRRVIAQMVKERGPEKSVCPSEVARRIAPDGDWRALMAPVREVAFAMADAGKINVTQKGAVVDGRTVKGAIRLRCCAK
jgi:hypothetical protein